MCKKQNIYKYVILVAILAFTISAQAAEISCPSYWSDSSVDVSISIPLSYIPPDGKKYFLLSPPELQGHKVAEQYEIANKTLYTLFCGVSPEYIQKGLILQIGPNKISIPATQLILHKSKRTEHERITAQVTRAITPNWISLTKVSYQSPVDNAQVNLNLQFFAPAGMQTDIRSLKIRLLSEFSHCRSRLPGFQYGSRLTIPVLVTARLGDSRDTKTYNATFSPTCHCGPPVTLEIDFGPFKYPKSTGRQHIFIRIYKVMIKSVDSDKLEQLYSSYSLQMGQRDVHPRNNDKGEIILHPPTAIEFEAKESNVYPKSYRAWREDFISEKVADRTN